MNPIAKLNDELRRALLTLQTPTNSRVTMTPGVAALPAAQLRELMVEIATFEDFNEENDPYGEHDMVLLTYKGTRYLAKIDYYDLTQCYGSDDPANKDKTVRVLTMMRSDEY